MVVRHAVEVRRGRSGSETEAEQPAGVDLVPEVGPPDVRARSEALKVATYCRPSSWVTSTARERAAAS
jgi:hypothetical protein